MITLYNAISSDGFLARKDGSEDFIPERTWQEFLGLLKNYDTLVLSRKAYEAIQTYDSRSIKEFESLGINKIVITANPNFIVKPGYTVSRSPEEALSLGKNIILTGGSILNAYVLEHNLIDRIILNIVPVKIKEGIAAFSERLDVPFMPAGDSGSEGGLFVHDLKK